MLVSIGTVFCKLPHGYTKTALEATNVTKRTAGGIQADYTTGQKTQEQPLRRTLSRKEIDDFDCGENYDIYSVRKTAFYIAISSYNLPGRYELSRKHFRFEENSAQTWIFVIGTF